eukprot:tig00000851_g4894.t1
MAPPGAPRIAPAGPGTDAERGGRPGPARAEAKAGKPGQAEFRTAYLNDFEQNKLFKYVPNVVKTAKYSLWNFVPKNLFEQFRRIANFYFLIISILQLATDLSPTNKYSTALPLCGVLAATMVKEAFEDYKRHRMDHTVNNSKAKVLRGGQFVEARWKELQVGDIVHVANRDEFPADLIIVSSSEDQGMCYIETSNLDGETNLKIRQALDATSRCTEVATASKLRGSLRYELPNNRLYNFEGTLALEGARDEIPVDVKSIALRGAQLRNTAWIYGLVVFTGKETKLMQNARATPSKRSNIERVVNALLVIIFVTLLLMCTVSTIVGAAWSGSNRNAWYLPFLFGLSGGESAAGWVTFLILYNNLVPISLYVSLELVKIYQARLMESDGTMYHDESDTPASARTSNLNEDLGQIRYIFSDKTGTLTRNEMEFKKCSIGGVASSLLPGRATVPVPGAERIPAGAAVFEQDPAGKFDFADTRLLGHVREGHENSARIDDFLRALAVCHTVIPERGHDAAHIVYQASSPDEGALVTAAKCLGYGFRGRTARSVTITVFGREETYEVLATCEFNSARKRMSVIVRTPEGRIVLYTKGADTVIFERLNAAAAGKEALLEHLNDFATEGLRTLVIGRREIAQAEYDEWSRTFLAAATALDGREAKLDAAAELIEKELVLVGATAIEDKLQEGVPDAIATLAAAGIKIWVLTGDKVETAINIGFSCRLLTDKMVLIVINEETKKDVRESLLSKREQYKELIGGGLPREPLQKAQVVKMVKDNVKPTPMTLAIGDGANDVTMIQEAHIGIGISGKEGMQAVRAADYAIAQFRFLKRLLLVHGRWNYKRVSKVILYSFYKNISFVLTLFYFGFYNGKSGTTLFESWLGAFWNVGFTLAPIILVGILDQDVSAASSEENPRLYLAGQWGMDFNAKRMAVWLAQAIAHSCVVYFMCVGAVGKDAPLPDGTGGGLYYLGTVVNFCLVLTVTYKICLETRHWTWLNHLFTWGSVAFWFLFVIVYSAMLKISSDFYFLAYAMFKTAAFWLCALLVPVVANLPDFCFKYITANYFPTYLEIIRELQRLALREGGEEAGSAGPTMRRSSELLAAKAAMEASGGVAMRAAMAWSRWGVAVTAVRSVKYWRSRSTNALKQAFPTGFAFSSPTWQTEQVEAAEERRRSLVAQGMGPPPLGPTPGGPQVRSMAVL